MALSNAEKQRRYRARHVMVPRDAPAQVALEPQAVPVPSAVAPDLTEVRAALAEARHVLANRYPHLPVLCQQVQTLMTVLERLVEAFEAGACPRP